MSQIHKVLEMNGAGQNFNGAKGLGKERDQWKIA